MNEDFCEKCHAKVGKPVQFVYGMQSTESVDPVRSGKGYHTTATSYYNLQTSDPIRICFDCAKQNYLKNLPKQALFVAALFLIAIILWAAGSGGGRGSGWVVFLALAGGVFGVVQLITVIKLTAKLPQLEKLDETSNFMDWYRVEAAIETQQENLKGQMYNAFLHEYPR